MVYYVLVLFSAVMVYYVLVLFSGCAGLLCFSVVLGLCWFTMIECRSRAVLVYYVLVFSTF